MSRSEYLALVRLRENPDYQVLQGKWLFLISEIEKARDAAASRPSEGNWKYYAGQEKGAKRIVMALELAIKDLETQDQDLVDEGKYDDLLNEIRGGKK